VVGTHTVEPPDWRPGLGGCPVDGARSGAAFVQAGVTGSDGRVVTPCEDWRKTRTEDDERLRPGVNPWVENVLEWVVSTPGGIRTPNPRFRRPMLYPVELRTQRITIATERIHDDSIRGHANNCKSNCIVFRD
jgi:hypothetical protein